MRAASVVFSFLFVLLMVFSCDEKTKKSDQIALNAEELAWFEPYYPLAVSKIVHTIPTEMLSQKDRDMNNDHFWALYDAQKNLLAYARLIGDPLSCASGKCKAIRFFLLFDPNLNYTHIFHPAGKSGDFFKGIEGDFENDTPFTAEDWELLHSLLLDPPTSLLEAENVDQIVDAVTTATYEPYWDDVVRQAAYTTYYVLHHMVTSREYMQAVLGVR